MNDFDRQYLSLLKRVLSRGERRITRSGAGTISVHGEMIKHDLSRGFPLTTLRAIPFRLVSTELEWTLRGKTDKNSLQALNNHIWDKFCNPTHVKHLKNYEKKFGSAFKDNDLGPIYGFQWRHFGARYTGPNSDYKGLGFDQIKTIIKLLKSRSFSKRMVITNWNPAQVEEMAVPCCPVAFSVIRHGDRLNLSFFQRSADAVIGLPFDFAFYALLLHLFALEARLKPGSIVGFFNNIEIFDQHIANAKKLIRRTPKRLARMETRDFKTILKWKHDDSRLAGYKPNDQLKFEVHFSS